MRRLEQFISACIHKVSENLFHNEIDNRADLNSFTPMKSRLVDISVMR